MAKEKVTLFEVGPRDGLQNEADPVSVTDRVWFIRALLKAGLRHIEWGSFVRPDRVPQMAATSEVVRALKKERHQGWILVPNLHGLDRALREGCRRVAVFTAASDGFNEANIGMSVAESLKVVREVVREAERAKCEVRGYVSTAFGCPFDGEVKPAQALRVIRRLLELGIEQVSVGDTIGVAHPRRTRAVFEPLMREYESEAIAAHFHDTYGMALVNIQTALELGVRTFDASAGGLGGCPFAPGATGNVATEEVLVLLESLGYQTGVDREAVLRTSIELSKRMSKPSASRYVRARLASRGRAALL